MGDISCNKLLFSTFKNSREPKLRSSIRSKTGQETWYGEENKRFTPSRVFTHHQPGWLGESAEDRIWHPWGRSPDRRPHGTASQCGQPGMCIWPTVAEGGKNGPRGNWQSEQLHLEGKLSRLLTAQNVKFFEKANTVT